MENKTTEVAKKLDSSVLAVITEKQLGGFEKAFQISQAIIELRGLLTPEYMKPIMALQGSSLGFKTDKDKTGGYPEEVVKNCLIDATLHGLSPYNNEFNIISGVYYATKQGLHTQLKNIPGLKYDIVCGFPKVNAEKTSAGVEAKVTWSVNGGPEQTKEVPIPIKIDQYSSVDAIQGKATRKARAWLYQTVTGRETPEGEVSDVQHTVVGSKIELPTPEELQILLDDKIEFIDAKELKEAKRIIDGKETASYKKLFDTLNKKGKATETK